MLIPYPELEKRHKFKPKGVVHIGGSTGQERFFYANAGIENVVWIEAIPKVFEELKRNVSGFPKNIALNACISDKDFKSVTFNVSSHGGESSSVFNFKEHSKHYPDIKFVEQLKLTTIRVDTLLTMKEIDIRDYDYLSCDLQGSELVALKSMGDMLRCFNYVYIEVNKTHLYENMPLVGEIDSYLSDFGFNPVDEKYTPLGWGDKFYVKDQDMSSVFNRQREARVVRNGIVNVPPKFLTEHPFPYPPDNKLIFEKWYYANYVETPERLYLPIQWTGYHCTHSFGNNEQKVKELQDYVDTLDRTKKYYTIHQFDLGCMVDFKDLDILVFGMAGGRIDYCLPLLCQPHRFEFSQPKTLFASFVGRRTHPLRETVINNLKNKQGCYISEAQHDLSAYCSILASSTFGVCVRGYGNNSFRIQESIQYGAIPVIISNERLEPHGIPFEEYGVYIDESDAGNVYEILQNLTVDEVTEKQSKLKWYFDSYFLYGSNRKIILDILNKNNDNPSS